MYILMTHNARRCDWIKKETILYTSAFTDRYFIFMFTILKICNLYWLFVFVYLFIIYIMYII